MGGAYQFQSSIHIIPRHTTVIIRPYTRSKVLHRSSRCPSDGRKVGWLNRWCVIVSSFSFLLSGHTGTPLTGRQAVTAVCSCTRNIVLLGCTKVDVSLFVLWLLTSTHGYHRKGNREMEFGHRYSANIFWLLLYTVQVRSEGRESREISTHVMIHHAASHEKTGFIVPYDIMQFHSPRYWFIIRYAFSAFIRTRSMRTSWPLTRVYDNKGE